MGYACPVILHLYKFLLSFSYNSLEEYLVSAILISALDTTPSYMSSTLLEEILNHLSLFCLTLPPRTSAQHT